MDPILITIVAILAAGGGITGYNVYQKRFKSTRERTSKTDTSPEIANNAKVLDAETRAREIIVEAKDEAFKLKKEAEDDARQARNEIMQLEQRLAQKEVSIESKLTKIEDKEKDLEGQKQALATKTEDLEKKSVELITKLEKAAGMTRDEAKKVILDATDTKLKDEVARRIREAEANIKEEADKKAQEILVSAMQRGATDYVAEYTTSVVKLPDDEIKGRIIGKEGRNIRALEMATGVDFDIDDTPGEIRLSSFDGERREVARVSLERLIADGRIQPQRIEEVVDKTRREFEKIRREEGEKLMQAVGVNHLPGEIVEALGKFKWRFSYGQSLVIHTLEETKIGVGIARELGLDVNKVRLGCLFHDIGKAFTPEVEGSHVEVGANFLRKFNIPKDIVAIVEEHHEDKPFSSLESVIVWIADAISGSRPGARHESVEEYIKRISELETVAKSFPGVDKTFAIQAGREVRVIVVPHEVDDAGITKLAHDIASKIHDTMTYPGQVKVTVIRENRAVEVAK